MAVSSTDINAILNDKEIQEKQNYARVVVESIISNINNNIQESLRKINYSKFSAEILNALNAFVAESFKRIDLSSINDVLKDFEKQTQKITNSIELIVKSINSIANNKINIKAFEELNDNFSKAAILIDKILNKDVNLSALAKKLSELSSQINSITLIDERLFIKFAGQLQNVLERLSDNKIVENVETAITNVNFISKALRHLILPALNILFLIPLITTAIIGMPVIGLFVVSLASVAFIMATLLPTTYTAAVSARRLAVVFSIIGEALSMIIKIVVEMSLLQVVFKGASLSIKMLFAILKDIMGRMNKLAKDVKIGNVFIFRLKMWLLASAIHSITSVEAAVAWCGLAAIVAIPAAALVMLSLLSLLGVSLLIHKLGRSFSIRRFLSFKLKSLLFISALGSVALIGLSIIAIAVTSAIAIPATIIVGLMLLAILGLSKLIQLVGSHVKNTLKGIVGLALVCGALIGIAYTFAYISELAQNINLLAIGLIVASIIVMSFLMILVGKFVVDMLKGAIGMVLIAGALYVVALAVGKIVEASAGLEWSQLGSFFLLLAAMVGSVIALGALISLPPVALFAAIGGVTLLALSGIFIAVAKSVKEIRAASEGLDNTVVENMTNLITDMVHSVSKISLKDMIKATAAGVTIRPFISMLGTLAHTIGEIAKMNIPVEFDENGNPTKFRQINDSDFTAVGANVNIMIDTLINAISSLSDKVSVGDALKTTVLMALMGTTVTPVANMVKTIQDIASGRFADQWDENGKPTHWITFSEIPFDKITANIRTCITSYIDAIKNSGLEDDSSMFGEDGPLAKAKDGIKLISGITEPISQIIDVLVKTQESVGKYNGKLFFQSAVKQYLDGVKEFQEIDTTNIQKSLTTYNSLNDAITKVLSVDEKQIENNRKFVDNNVKLLDKINSVKTENIRGVTEMFGKMAEFSQTINGNFEKLAEAFSQELIDALNKLSDALTGEHHLEVQTQPAPVQTVQKPTSNVKAEDIKNILNTINDLKDILQRPITVTNTPTKPLIVSSRNI